MKKRQQHWTSKEKQTKKILLSISGIKKIISSCCSCDNKEPEVL